MGPETTGSVHAAAKELGLTQTAVSKRIQALEAELALTLFLRSRRGMSLTEDGAILLRHCRSLQELEGLFRSQVSGQIRMENSITVVGPTSVISTRVAVSCAPLYKKYLHLRLHLRSEDHLEGFDLVRRGEADFAITPVENIPNQMQSKRLQPDRFLLLASPSLWCGTPEPRVRITFQRSCA